MKYDWYKSVDDSDYKAESSKDGVTDDAISDLRRVVKGNHETEAYG